MAKKTEIVKQLEKATETITTTLTRNLIKKKYGDGFLSSALDIIDRKETIINISPKIDELLRGGIVDGTWINVIGPAKYGKTTLILRMAACAQKLGYFILYVNAEHRLKKMNLEGCKGLDLSNIEVLGSSDDETLDGEKCLSIIEDFLKMNDKVFVIIDSLSSLPHPKQVEEGTGTSTRGGMGVLISQFINNVCGMVNKKGHIVVCVQQHYSNTSGYGKNRLASGGSKVVYQGDCILEAKARTEIKSGEKIIGQSVTWQCDCSALGTIPGTKIDSIIKYGTGIYPEMELVEMAKEIGIIESAEKGAWLTYGEQKIQGAAKFAEFLEENPLIYKEIEQKIKDSYKELRDGK